MTSEKSTLRAALDARFADPPAYDAAPPNEPGLARLAARGSQRTFRTDPVADSLLQLLAAVALAAPSKSDLQQRDIIVISDPGVRRTLNRLLAEQTWIAEAPALLVFCGNNRRQRLVHAWRDKPFVNDHLDAFFNAAVDGAIALGAFVTAAEAAGLGCCPISAIRNHADDVSDLLALPDHVFPVAGLAVGWPQDGPVISKRLPLAVTLHRDRYGEEDLQDAIAAYDRERAAAQPYETQRYAEEFGRSEPYGWSEDKARQYAKPERPGFGAFVRRKGFDLS